MLNNTPERAPNDSIEVASTRPGGVHAVNATSLGLDLAGAAARRITRAAQIGVESKNTALMANAEYAQAAIAYAQARDAGASIGNLVSALDEELRRAGLTYTLARAGGVPCAKSRAQVEGLAFAGRILQKPGSCDVPVRTLVGRLTRIYNRLGGSDVLRAIVETALTVDDAVALVEGAVQPERAACDASLPPGVSISLGSPHECLELALWALKATTRSAGSLRGDRQALATMLQITATVMALDEAIGDPS